MPLYSYVAAVSVGIVNDEAVCDLDYVEDSGGEVDFNFIMDDEGNITKRQFMRISFTFDHRLIDGATAAKFELAIKELLEKPMQILL